MAENVVEHFYSSRKHHGYTGSVFDKLIIVIIIIIGEHEVQAVSLVELTRILIDRTVVYEFKINAVSVSFKMIVPYC